MPTRALIKAFVFVVVVALVVFAGIMGARSGVAWEGLIVIGLGVTTLFSGLVAWTLRRKMNHRDQHTRQLRFIADRFQAMVRTFPGGYCLFTPQGLLREEYGVAARLGLRKIAHFDEIIEAIKEGPELVTAFRVLQETEEDFTLLVHAVQDNKSFEVSGQRFRIGHGGPQIDILWFKDSFSVTPNLQKNEAASAESKGRRCQKEAAFDFAPFPVWLRGQNLRLVMCNKAYAEALGGSVEDILRDQRELMSQTARGGSGRALAANALGRNEPQKERRHVIVDGKRRLLEITEAPLPPSSGDSTEGSPSSGGPPESLPEGSVAAVLVGFAVDVTSEEEKETELQRHLAAHHEVMEHLGTAIAVYGPDTRLEFYNRAYQQLWETEESFLDGKPTFGEVLENLRTRRRLPEQIDFQRYKKERLALFTSLLEPLEDMMYLPDGTVLRILVVPHPLGGLLFVNENVTGRLALETSYNTLVAVQRETLDNLAEGVAVFGPDGKLRLSNPAFARIWKLSQDYLAQTPHIADLLEHMKPLFNFGANWDGFKHEMVGYALDRNARTGRIERADKAVIEFLTVPLPDGAVLNSYLDVSDSVRVEQALRASNAALAAADRLKSDFVANVSYQLRTPLNTIIGFSEILCEQYFGTLNERQLEYTSTIKMEGEKLSRLINDVLDLAMIEAGRMVLDRKPVGIGDLLNAAKQMTAEWVRQQSLEIVIDCPADLGKFEVDEHRMKQVLFNLISNAIKYTPAGGRITLGAHKQDGWIVLQVRDTGIGIPYTDSERIFGKFERTNLQSRQSGVGLGLSLVRSFVEMHGGRVEIASDVNKGTCVSCFVPMKAQERAK